jgi:hypothetical protein
MIQFLSKIKKLIIKKEDFINFTEHGNCFEMTFYTVDNYGKRITSSIKEDIDFFKGLYMLIDKEWVKI